MKNNFKVYPNCLIIKSDGTRTPISLSKHQARFMDAILACKEPIRLCIKPGKLYRTEEQIEFAAYWAVCNGVIPGIED